MRTTHFRSLTLLLTVFVLLLGPAVHADDPSAGRNEAFADAQAIQLTEAQVKGFFSAAKEFKAADIELEQPEGEAPSISQWTDSIEGNAKVRQIINRNGFDSAERFAQTAYSVMTAFGALELQNNRAELEQAQAQLQKMKDQLPPETYAMLEEKMLGAMKMFGDQPAGNIELVSKYRAEIESLSDN